MTENERAIDEFVVYNGLKAWNDDRETYSATAAVKRLTEYTASIRAEEREKAKALVESPMAEDKGGLGWTISVDYLDTIQDKVAHLSWEDIEAVLLAHRELAKAALDSYQSSKPGEE